jgi:hypothetical protein
MLIKLETTVNKIDKTMKSNRLTQQQNRPIGDF